MQDLGRRRSSMPAYATRSGSRAGRSNHTPTWPQPSPRLSGAASTAKPSTRRNRRYLRSDNRHRLLAVLSTAGAAGRLTSDSGQHGQGSAFADSQDRTAIHCCDLCSDRSGARACRGVPRSTRRRGPRGPAMWDKQSRSLCRCILCLSPRRSVSEDAWHHHVCYRER